VLRQRARELLAEARIPLSGQPAFAILMDREEAFPGPASNRAPDLLLVPSDERLVVTADMGSKVWSASLQTGLHSFEGMWIHASPAMEPRRLSRPISIVDVAPTLLADVGARYPRHVHGRVVREAFRHEVRGSPALDFDEAAFKPITPAVREHAMTVARLQAMGYL